jgi:hypothetical protein
MFATQSRVMDQLRLTSDAMGEQQERLQALNHMAGLADVSAESLAASLDFLQRTLGGITDEGDAAAIALGKIGITVEQLRALSPTQQMEAIARGLNALESSADRAAIRAQLFGRGSREMTDLLRELGTQGIDPTIEKLEALGITLTRVQTQAVDNAGDALYAAKAVLDGVSQQAVAAMAPFIQLLAEAFVDSAEDAGAWGVKVGQVLDQVAVGGIVMASKLRGPMNAIEAGIERMWAAYQGLPPWAQEVGIVGAILGGKKGAAVVVGLGVVAESSKEAARWMAALNQALESSPENASMLSVLQRAKELAAEIGKTEMQTEGPSIIEKLFGGATGADGKTAEEWADERIAEYRAAMARIAAETQQGAAAAEGLLTSGGGEVIEPAPDFKYSKEDNEAYAQRVAERFMTERELTQAAYEEEGARLAELLQQKTTVWDDYWNLKEQRAQEHADKMKAIDEAERAAKLAIVGNMLGSISVLMNTHSRKAFEIGKAAAISSAIIDTYAGMNKALAQGGFYGIAMAAAVAAKGFASVSAIRAQQFGSGGSGGGGAGAGSVTQSINAATTPVGGPVQPSRNVSITLVGGNAASFSAQQVRNLITQINEQIGDGATLQLSGG